MLDKSRFQQLWLRLGLQRDADATFAHLVEAYGEPGRAYHNAAHLEECLRQFDLAHVLAERPDEVDLALWFHDAVYDPHAVDNEERSAALAIQSMTHPFWSRPAPTTPPDAEVAGRIAALIVATRHDREPHSPDCELMLDVDLSIFGQDPEVFAQYERGIRMEYVWVPEEQYRAGRASILERFLKRLAIYRTPFFRNRLEAQARRNLEESLVRLR